MAAISPHERSRISCTAGVASLEKSGYQWSQDEQAVTISLACEVGDPETLRVSFGERGNSVSLAVEAADNRTCVFALEQLFMPIDPSASSARVPRHRRKVILTLVKHTPGQEWLQLRRMETHPI
jgi:hypothetical protein|eukprot:gene10159-3233_t